MLAKLLAGELAGVSLKIHAHEFKAVRLGTAKTFDGECQPLRRVIRNGEHTPSQVELLRP